MQKLEMTPNRQGHILDRILLMVLLCGAGAPVLARDSLATAQWVQKMFMAPPVSAPLPDFNDSYGVVFRDLNNDGDADIYVVRFRDLNRLFLNQGGGQFLDYTIRSGLGGNLMSSGKQNLELGAAAADMDNNGWQDILIVGWNHTTQLFRQQRALRFSETVSFAAQFPPIDGNAGVWADVDRDGDLDLFVTDEHHPNHFFVNEGYGQFTDQSTAFGLALEGVSQGATFGDLDGDDFPDLYVCNWLGADVLYRNIGGRKFEKMSLPLAHLQEPLNSNGVSFGDIDNDGDADIVVTDRTGSSRVYENGTIAGSRNWVFRDVTDAVGLANPFPAYGSVIADLDNNGWQDIFFTNIGPNRLFLNRGGRFYLAYEERLPGGRMTAPGRSQHYSTGAAVADFDNDGDLDLFVANKDSISMLYVNPLDAGPDSGNFVRLRLEGVTSNRDAIGAKVWLYADPPEGAAGTGTLAGYREISGGAGYLSVGEGVVHLAPSHGKNFSLRIRFPSGTEIFRSRVIPGQTLAISESGGLRKTATRARQFLAQVVRTRHFWLNLALLLLWLGGIVGLIVFFIRRYRWQNTQTALFLISLMALGYLLVLLLGDAEIRLVLLLQLGILLVVGAVAGGFMEKIHRLERRRYGYRQLLEKFSGQLIFIKNNAELFEKIVTALRESLKVDYCALLAARAEPPGKESGTTLLVFQAGAGNWPAPDLQLLLPATAVEQCVTATILKPQLLRKVAPPLGQYGPALALAPARAERLLALILLGPRRDRREFDAEDQAILKILTRQAAIAIENNLYIEESKRLIQKLTEGEIRERYIRELEEKNQTLEKLYRDLQETQAQLIQSEKMAGLGQLVAGVAHELNNPISFVYANMKALQRYTTAISELLHILKQLTDSAAAEAPGLVRQLAGKLRAIDRQHDLAFLQKDIDHLIAESLEGSRRVKAVVENLRNFSRLDEGELKAVDLHEGLESTLMLLNTELKNRIAVHKSYGTLPRILCNPGQINQVFMNLLVNAAQAIEEKGDIWIETHQRGNHVEIVIRDNGKGIPPDIQSRIFNPFFTTKPVGKGTGLGLSVSYGIIKKHGGDIRVESTMGTGTTFTVVLPAKN